MGAGSSWRHYPIEAAVHSTTTDPGLGNNVAKYIIIPNYHGNGSDYWNAPGNLTYLDFNGFIHITEVKQADLRIASSFALFNNNLPYGMSETISLLIFNNEPTTASHPGLTTGYSWSMDYSAISSRGEETSNTWRS